MIKVPIQLVEWGLKHPQAFRTLLFLKRNSSGYVRRETLSKWAQELEISLKTLRRHLKILEERRWVNTHNGVTYLRSMARIKIIEGWEFKGKQRLFDENFKDIKSWLFQAIVHRFRRYARRHRASSLIKKGGTSKMTYVPLSVRYLSVCLGIDKSLVQRYKTHAIKAGAVKRMRNLVDITEKEAKALSYLQCKEGEYSGLTYQGGRQALRRPDLLSTF